jgi:hypothetical protein
MLVLTGDDANAAANNLDEFKRSLKVEYYK